MVLSMLISIFSFMVTFPLVLIPVFYLLFRIRRQERKVAFQHTTDLVTFFLILNLQTVIFYTFQSKAFLWWYLIVLLVVMLLLSLLQWRLHGDFYPQRILRAGWRISFLLLLVLHLVTTVIGIVYQYQLS